MSAISQYQNDIKRYEALKEQISSVIASMSLVVNNASDLEEQSGSRYQIDNISTPIAVRTKILKEKIEKDIEHLESALRAVDGCISSISRKVASLQEFERKQAEQARKEKKQ